MNIILSVNDEIERMSLRAVLKRVDIVSDITVMDDVNSIIKFMENSTKTIAIIGLETFIDSVMETFSNIRNLKDKNSEAKFILIADKDEDVITSAAFRFGINYVIVRPYQLEAVVERIQDLSVSGVVINDNIEIKNKQVYIERMTSSILNGTGILPNLKGYKYLKEAIVSGYSNREVLDAVTKFLYPEIAKHNNTTADRVERAIRHAIESAWSKCGGNGFYEKMGFGHAYGNKRPTNSEYIFAVVEYLNNHAV